MTEQEIKAYIESLKDAHRKAILKGHGTEWKDEAPIFDAIQRADAIEAAENPGSKQAAETSPITVSIADAKPEGQDKPDDLRPASITPPPQATPAQESPQPPSPMVINETEDVVVNESVNEKRGDIPQQLQPPAAAEMRKEPVATPKPPQAPKRIASINNQRLQQPVAKAGDPKLELPRDNASPVQVEEMLMHDVQAAARAPETQRVTPDDNRKQAAPKPKQMPQQSPFPMLGNGINPSLPNYGQQEQVGYGGMDGVGIYADIMADATEAATESLITSLERMATAVLMLKNRCDEITKVLDRSFNG